MGREPNPQDLKSRILELKKAKRAVILAHNYQAPPIQDIADYLGDSLELARIFKRLAEPLVVFCGVQFMAETAKILSPRKKVLIPVRSAGCALAEMITVKQLSRLKREHPDAWVVSYVNSSAAVKALSDVCCTSSNAVTVVRNIPAGKVIFVPDKNLGWWVARNVPEKQIIIWPGYCPVHDEMTVQELEETKEVYPDALVLVHPECRKEILERADYVLSTAGMLKAADSSGAKRFIIGTEEGLIYRLRKNNPGKDFYPLGRARICEDMKKVALTDLDRCLAGETYAVELDPLIIEQAAKAIERMVSFKDDFLDINSKAS